MRGIGQPSVIAPASTPGPWAGGFVSPNAPAPATPPAKSISFKKPLVITGSSSPPPATAAAFSDWLTTTWASIPYAARVCLVLGLGAAGVYFVALASPRRPGGSGVYFMTKRRGRRRRGRPFGFS